MSRALLAFLIGCSIQNPPVTREIRWVDGETEQLARRACYDCHSNETHWPWYTWVPGVGGMVKADVEEGRCQFNFSTWDRPAEEVEDAPKKILEREMPLLLYLKHHRDARLTDAERERLADGIEKTIAQDPPLPGEPCDDDEREVEDD